MDVGQVKVKLLLNLGAGNRKVLGYVGSMSLRVSSSFANAI